MLEILVGFLALMNSVLLVLFIRSVDRGVTGKKQYEIVNLRGEVLQGPLTLKKAQSAQERWDDLFVFYGGPQTSIRLVRKVDPKASPKSGSK